MATTRTDLRPLPPRSLPQRLQAWGARAVEDFRRSDRFFKMRVGVVGTWLLLSVVTLWAACPGSGPSNSLGAEVQVLRESLVGGEQILVRNESDQNWEDVVLTLDGGWEFLHRTLRPHDQLVLAVAHFRKDGASPPPGFRPRSLAIRCAQGKARLDLK